MVALNDLNGLNVWNIPEQERCLRGEFDLFFAVNLN